MGADSAMTLDGHFRVAIGITTYVLPRRACQIFLCQISPHDPHQHHAGRVRSDCTDAPAGVYENEANERRRRS
jgi:hypothetical protein